MVQLWDESQRTADGSSPLVFKIGARLFTFLGRGRKVRLDRVDVRAIFVVESPSTSHPQTHNRLVVSEPCEKLAVRKG